MADVGPGAAGQGVGAGVPEPAVAPVTEDDEVGAVAAEHPVVAPFGRGVVVAGTEVEHVGSRAAVDRVRAALGADDVVAGARPDRVRGRSSEDDVVRRRRTAPEARSTVTGRPMQVASSRRPTMSIALVYQMFPSPPTARPMGPSTVSVGSR